MSDDNVRLMMELLTAHGCTRAPDGLDLSMHLVRTTAVQRLRFWLHPAQAELSQRVSYAPTRFNLRMQLADVGNLPARRS